MLDFYSQKFIRITKLYQTQLNNGVRFANAFFIFFRNPLSFVFCLPSSVLFFLFASIFYLPSSIFSQSVGIFGSTNLGVNNTGAKGVASSIFDISSTTGGILIPRMTTAQRDAFSIVTPPATSLLIYNTTTNQYEFYNGASWVGIATAGGTSGWNTSGNTGTVDGTHFIGTTDNIPFNIRVNNQKAGRIENTNANTFFGYQSGNSISSGINNTAIGYQSFFSSATGDNNTAIGQNALYSNASGYENTAVGNLAMENNTGGQYNTAIGMWSLNFNETGSQNTAIGYKALLSSVAGSNATAIGKDAMLYSNNTATGFTNFNVAVGYEALRGSITPASNTGNNNTALGYQTLLNNTSGGSNAAFGVQSLNSNTSGNFNTAIGWRALYSNNIGADNTATGYRALLSNTSGLRNTAYGVGAGYTAVAANAVTTGSENTFIGYNSGFASATQRSNATAIGSNALVDASNALVLGGTGANAVNVGIGTSLPLATLDITSDGGSVLLPRKSSVGDPAGAANGMIYYNSNSNKFRIYENGAWVDVVAGAGSSPWSRTAPFTYLTTGTDNVGIGLSNPSFKLDVSGTSRLSPSANRWANVDVDGTSLRLLLEDQSTATPKITFAGGAGTGTIETTGNMGLFLDVNATANVFKVRTYNGASLVDRFIISSGSAVANAFFLASNVGIGTSVPATKLHVSASAEGESRIRITNTTAAKDFDMFTSNAGNFHLRDGLAGPVLLSVLGANGNVGIGTTDPVSLLHVMGNVRLGFPATVTGSITFNNSTNSNTITIQSSAASPGYTLFLPTAQGAASTVLQNDGAGNLSWASLPAASNDWTILGNASTVDGTNFIGTTDNIPFNIRVNNQRSGYIGNLVNHSVFLGYQAGLNDATIGTTAIGSRALTSNTTGSINTAVGLQALYSNIAGNSNTALGANTMYSNTYASQNVALGRDALYTQSYANGNITWATDNTALGYQALYSNQPTLNTNGYQNTAIGSQALYLNTTGSINTSIGYRALRANTTGTDNTASGWGALTSNTTASYSTAVGSQALYLNTIGAENTAIGYQSLSSNTTGSQNTAVGWGSLYSQSFNNGGSAWSSNNTAIGYEALYSNQPTATNNGVFNTAIGNFALRSNTTGASNTASGYNALYSNTDGYSNTASGVNALQSNTRGFWNIATGENALKNNSTASKNVAIGNQSLFLQGTFTNGGIPWNSNNVAVGHEALYSNQPTSTTDGIQNTAVGIQAMYANTSGRFNTALGFRALYNFNDPAKGDNTAIGNEALYGNLSGGANTATGDFALHSNTTGDWNTATGTFAGDFITTGSGNTFIGYDADATNSALTKAAAIGYNAKVDASNTMILGGTGADAVNVGIGTSLPLATLDITNDGGTVLLPRKTTVGDPGGAVNGMIYYNSNTNKFRAYENGAWGDIVAGAGSLPWSRTAPYIYLTTGTDNVGIGTTAPAAKLHIGGNSELRIGDGVATAAQLLTFFTPGAGFQHTIEGGGDNNALIVRATRKSGADALLFNTYDAAATSFVNRITITGGATTANVSFSNSNVGIGTISPITRFHVAGNIPDYVVSQSSFTGAGDGGFFATRSNGTVTAPTAILNNDAIGTYGFLGYDGAGFNGGGYIQGVAAENFSPTNQGMYMKFTTTSIGSAGSVERMRITDAGYVGIGTTAPLTNLHVASNTMGTSVALQVSSDAGNQGGFSLLRSRNTMAAPAAVMLNDNLGNIGFIGHDGIAFGSTGPAVEISATAMENFTGTAHGTELQFRTTPLGSTTTSTRMIIGASGLITIPNLVGPGNVQADASGNLSVAAVPSGANAWTRSAPNTYLTNSSDNVGIGTTAPSDRLEIEATLPNMRFDLTDPNQFSILNFSQTGTLTGGIGQWGATYADASLRNDLSIINQTAGGGAGDIAFHLNGDLATPMAIIKSSGNVGIGTTAPKGKLQVVGDAALGDGTAANEGVVTVFLTNNTGAASVKGEIVIVDPAVNNAFVKTTTAGHTSVIGVVYENGVASGSPCRIAISGIVPVIADAATTRGQHCITGTATAGAAGSVATPGAGTSIGVWLENVAVSAQGKVLLR